MNLPNCLTIGRFFLTAAFLYFAYQGGFAGYALAAGMFTAAAVSDFLDGYFAKKYQLVTDFGKIMDPIADKFLILSAFFIFVHLELISMGVFVLIAGREIAVTVSRLMLMSQGKVLAAEREGKIKTVLQIVAISLFLLYVLVLTGPIDLVFCKSIIPPIYALASVVTLLATAMTVYSGWTYFKSNYGH